jgi:hypothetical protein
MPPNGTHVTNPQRSPLSPAVYQEKYKLTENVDAPEKR